MRNIHSRLLIPVFAFSLGLLISTNLPGGKLLALQAGAGSATSSSQAQTNSSATGNDSKNTGTAPATNQASTDPDVARTFSWGSLVGSFIVGLIIGGVIFGTHRPSRIDRDNIRRAA